MKKKPTDKKTTENKKGKVSNFTLDLKKGKASEDVIKKVFPQIEDTHPEDLRFDGVLKGSNVEIKSASYGNSKYFCIEYYSDINRKATGGPFKSFQLDPNSKFIYCDTINGEQLLKAYVFNTESLVSKLEELLNTDHDFREIIVTNTNNGSIYKTLCYLIPKEELTPIAEFIVNFEPPVQLPTYLDVHQLAFILGVTSTTIRKWVSRGTIPHKKIGTKIRFDLTELLKWIKATNPDNNDDDGI